VPLSGRYSLRPGSPPPTPRDDGAGKVCLSGGVKQLVVDKQYHFEDRGEHSLKGFDEPIEIWQLKS